MPQKINKNQDRTMSISIEAFIKFKYSILAIYTLTLTYSALHIRKLGAPRCPQLYRLPTGPQGVHEQVTGPTQHYPFRL